MIHLQASLDSGKFHAPVLVPGYIEYDNISQDTHSTSCNGICMVRVQNKTIQIMVSNNFRHKLLHVMVITPACYGDHLINIYQTAGNPIVTHKHVLTTPAKTDITGGKPVRRYTIPSSTMVLPENRVPDKSHQTSERAGTTRPQT